MEGNRFDCAECTDELKKKRGCKGGFKWNIANYTIDKCPENYMTVEADRLMDMWAKFKTGYGLPFSGGWAEQPAILIDVFEALDVEQRKLKADGD